jgi:hypothetical protein
MKSTDFESIYGRTVNPGELADFLGLDRRTVIKYAHRWGGVEVAPGTWRFFEKRIVEVLNAEQGFEERNRAIPGECHRPGSHAAKDVSGREQEVLPGRADLGKRGKKGIGTEAIPDKYGIFGDGNVVQRISDGSRKSLRKSDI